MQATTQQPQTTEATARSLESATCGTLFADKFTKCVVSNLETTLGASAAGAVLYHTRLKGTLDDPARVHEGLVSMLRQGAYVVERGIVKDLYQGLGIPLRETWSDFCEMVEIARDTSDHGTTPQGGLDDRGSLRSMGGAPVQTGHQGGPRGARADDVQGEIFIGSPAEQLHGAGQHGAVRLDRQGGRMGVQSGIARCERALSPLEGPRSGSERAAEVLASWPFS